MNLPAFAAALPLRLAAPTRPHPRTPRTKPAPAARAAPIRRPENVPGDLYVDTSCIDCDTCRWLAPETFHATGGQSAVHTQPTTAASRLSALRAATACPTASIRTVTPSPLARVARDSFPLPAAALAPTPVPAVFYNGFASRASFGAASWLLLHPAAPAPYALMFDCPRFFPPLARAIARLAAPVGGVKWLVLSHSDDVAGHEEWARALGATRVIHEAECNGRQKTDQCELRLADRQFPYRLDHGAELVHVPGHTRGSIALLHGPTQSLFTGDHFFYSARVGALTGSKYAMHSRRVMVHSIERLADLPFLHGWPGHGRHFHFEDDDDRRSQIAAAVDFMRETWHV